MANSEAHRPREPVIDDQLTLIFDVHINKKVVYDCLHVVVVLDKAQTSV